MGQYAFTYIIPEDFDREFSEYLSYNGEERLAAQLRECHFLLQDIGFAYYAGMRGDNWNKHALDVTIECTEDNLQLLKQKEKILKERIQRFLRPAESGFLVRNIDYYVKKTEAQVGEEKANDSRRSPRVFISYCWKDSSDVNYKDTVRNLAEYLVTNGVDVILDQWNLKPGYDRFVFMEESIENADRVLILCNKEYKEKAESRKGGVGAETAIITPEIYDRSAQDKFIPVVMDSFDSLPRYLKSRIAIDFTNQSDKREELLRAIFDKPAHTKPELGKRPEWLA